MAEQKEAVSIKKKYTTKNCHCEPVTEVTGVAIRIPLEMFVFLKF